MSNALFCLIVLCTVSNTPFYLIPVCCTVQHTVLSDPTVCCTVSNILFCLLPLCCTVSNTPFHLVQIKSVHFFLNLVCFDLFSQRWQSSLLWISRKAQRLCLTKVEDSLECCSRPQTYYSQYFYLSRWIRVAVLIITVIIIMNN